MNDFEIRGVKLAALLMLLGILTLAILFVVTAGCVTYAKQIITPTPEPTPVPTPTPEPTPTPTPTPEPTPDYSFCGNENNCHKLRDWVFWFRPDVEGLGNASGIRKDTGDLRTFATVYGYRYLPSYHWHSVSWGSRAFFLEKPAENMKFLFVFVNIYSDDTNGAGDVRQYGYEKSHFVVQVKDRLYYPDESYDEAVWIKEFQDMNIYDYAHKEGITPYGYRIVQDKGTGLIHADALDFIIAGRSNAWDGFIPYMVPIDSNENNTRVIAQFDNLGGTPNWILRE